MPNKYFIIDTNILVSAIVFSSSNPRLVIQKALSIGELVFSESILEEYTQTLSNAKFDAYLSLEKRLVFLNTFIANSKLVEITTQIHACRDPKDDKYLDLAISCKASCILPATKIYWCFIRLNTFLFLPRLIF
jgi:putative PIN family toxin of toxin-antitoxin system